MLDIKVISGAGYEPRKVESKVKERLNQNIDIFIYLITKEGESFWTRDELSYAYAKGYAIILLIEKSVKIEKGLLGDWEYLNFDREHIGDTYLGILEAIQYVRREKSIVEKQAQTE